MRRTLGLVALALASCSPFRDVTASVQEYAAYRPTRVAPSLHDRILAANLYLDRYPRGVFADDVRSRRGRAEAAFFASKEGSIAGLEAYLRALPEGPHATAAKDRLLVLRAEKAQREETGLAAIAEASLARATWERARVRQVTTQWIGAFLDPAAWRGSLVDAPGDVIVPWALSLPPPVCRAIEPPRGAAVRRCNKVVELPFAVVVGGVPEEREAVIEIAIVMDAAERPLEVRVGGPDLFLRLEEARTVHSISGDDPDARIDAIAEGIAIVRAEVEKRGPIGPDCERAVVAPTVLSLACGETELIVEAGRDGDDAVTLRPTLAPPRK
jgi:hypothetical protein